MTDYKVDPDIVRGGASALSAAADSSPSGLVPSAWGCGSSKVEAELDDDGEKFHLLWKKMNDATMTLSVGATDAVATYLHAEAEVAAAAERAGAHHE